MLGNEWVYAAIAGLLFAHLLTLVYAYRSNRSEPAADASAETPSVDRNEQRDPSVCRCPECGTENDSSYRFCRQCVAELPGAQLSVEQAGGRQQPY
jgi:hypothetical protein